MNGLFFMIENLKIAGAGIIGKALKCSKNVHRRQGQGQGKE